MFAILKTGGKQIKVQPGDEIFIEKILGEEGSIFTFNEILMIDDQVGTPYLNGATVKGTIIKQGKEKKLRVVRYHPKKNVNKVYGHRQPFTKVKIDSIQAKGSSKAANSNEEAA
ncbi:50S ribosomal protein L21 [Spiroplasma alleghenense]|uniref:Large ribosomal subunit protein bL21 n=1 Tax=Spiroplasma alleghenense TaxID=216931 RepID=A0A345Z4D4_9MOLU|nr:50S ribosomal protein L21 [Spiroplasma alleghenense]AXK51463.1 50S ribosomal protein L21 [Spiroplasma alleghenense]